MKKELLPLGTLVKLSNTNNKILIIGFRGIDDRKEIFDYIGLIYPFGFVDREKVVLFNSELIKDIVQLGYNTIEDEEFKKKLNEMYYN